MKKGKWLVLIGIVILLVGLIAGAAVLYQKLSEDYGGSNLMQGSQAQDQTGAAAEYAAPDFTVIDVPGKAGRSQFLGNLVLLLQAGDAGF